MGDGREKLIFACLPNTSAASVTDTTSGDVGVTLLVIILLSLFLKQAKQQSQQRTPRNSSINSFGQFWDPKQDPSFLNIPRILSPSFPPWTGLHFVSLSQHHVRHGSVLVFHLHYDTLFRTSPHPIHNDSDSSKMEKRSLNALIEASPDAHYWSNIEAFVNAHYPMPCKISVNHRYAS